MSGWIQLNAGLPSFEPSLSTESHGVANVFFITNEASSFLIPDPTKEQHIRKIFNSEKKRKGFLLLLEKRARRFDPGVVARWVWLVGPLRLSSGRFSQ